MYDDLGESVELPRVVRRVVSLVPSLTESVADTVDVDPVRAVRALHALAHRHRNPPRTAEQLVSILVHRDGMDDVGEILTPLLADLR